MISYTWDIGELKMIRRSKKYKREALERAAIEYLQNPRFGYRYHAETNGVNTHTLYAYIVKHHYEWMYNQKLEKHRIRKKMKNDRERKNNAKS